MVQTGWLQSWIGLFTAIGSMLLGIGDSLVAMAGGRSGPSVEIRLRAMDDDLPDVEQRVAKSIETLKARFPEAEVFRVEVAEGEPVQFRIVGALSGTDAEIADLAVSTGQLRFRMTATSEDERELGLDLERETLRAESYLKAHAAEGEDSALQSYNGLDPEEGGSPARLFFASEANRDERQLVPLMVESEERWRFDETALSRAFRTQDRNGRACIGFDIAPQRQGDFFDFTDEHEGQQLAIVVGSRILSRPTLNQPLKTGGMITGGGRSGSEEWTRSVDRIVRLLSAPRLSVRLQLVSIERRGR